MSLMLPNFEPVGNHSDARVITVRVMNERTPTPEQLDELTRVFNEHKENLRNSLAGLVVKMSELSDTSAVRIVSNSGSHTLYLWPAGGGSSVVLTETFWGIPTNSVAVNGALSPPSGSWTLPAEPTEMPDSLEMSNVLTAASDLAHPGHVTWSSADFEADGEPVVLAWRGPRDRYAATTGWTTAAGGAYTSHEPDTSQSINSEVFKDGKYLWINGRKVTTPVNKIIAAAIHCPDPVGAPGMCVLRICTDDITNSGTTRKVGCKDLVPTGETDPVDLGALLTAESYVVLATHTAILNGNGGAAGEWQLWQRPHFDHNGERVACTIRTGSTARWSMVCFDAESWAILEQVDLTSTSVSSGSQTIEDNTPTTPRIITISRTQGGDTIELLPLACDFLGADFVYCHMERHTYSNTVLTEVSNAGVNDHDYSEERVWGLSVKHSLHGTLYADSQDATYTTTYDSPSGGTGTRSAYTQPYFTSVSFVGDLSRDVFAVGSAAGAKFERHAAAGPRLGFNSSNDPYISADTTITVQPMKYDIWIGGQMRAASQSGAFVNHMTDVSGPTADAFTTVSLNYMAGYTGGEMPIAPANGTSVTNAQAYDASTGKSRALMSTVLYQHAAANAGKSVAYLGVHHRHGSSSQYDFGLELACFVSADGVYTFDNPPAYAGGSRPTISAPVFPGITREET